MVGQGVVVKKEKEKFNGKRGKRGKRGR